MLFLFSVSFFYSIRTVEETVPLLHKVVLHYKIIAACNT
jgi:hypothetical protein